jgi:hypothetical protein
MKKGFAGWFVLVSMIALCQITAFAQVPTPCATPVAQTCLAYGAGAAFVNEVTGWQDFDAAAFVVFPTLNIPPDNYAVELCQVDIAFKTPTIPTELFDVFLLSVYQIHDESKLPDLDAAGRMIWGRHYYPIQIPSPAPELLWVRFDMPSAAVDLPVINYGPIAIKIEYFMDPGVNDVIEMNLVNDNGSCSFVPYSNIYFEKATESYNFVDDVPLADSNWAMLARYTDNVPYIVPTLTPVGIGILIGLITLGSLRIRRKK